MSDQFQQLVKEGIAALNSGNSYLALKNFEEAAEIDESPELLSYLAYCLAKEKNDFSRAIALGKVTLEEEPWNSVHYLNLGRIYLLSGQRKDAINTFRDGLLHENNSKIKNELSRLGIRRYPVFASLPREHFLNRFIGKLFSKLKIR
ncbi:MAG TPA: hypothetical protein PLI53_06035 [Geobacteraceae bacterium]|nr:hypothetical protein [Geobacteraceae bacterium]